MSLPIPFLSDPYENVNKIIKLPPALRKSWHHLTSDAHWEIVPCRVAAEEGDCPNYITGDLLEFPVEGPDAKDLAQVEADLRSKGYQFLTVDAGRPGMHAIRIPPEQPCLMSWTYRHRRRRQEIPAGLVVVGGDHRGNPRQEGMRHTSLGSFVDHLHDHTDKLCAAQNDAAGIAPGAPLPTNGGNTSQEG